MNLNLRGGITLISKSLLMYMSSRGFFWTLAFGWMVGPIIFMFMWSSAAGESGISSFGRNDFLVYYLFYILINQLTFPTSHWVVGEHISLGTMSQWLLWPLPPIYHAIASDISTKVVCLPLVIASVVLLGLFTGVELDTPVTSLALFALTLALAQILRFMLAYTLALLAFWTHHIDALLAVNDTLLFLLAGQVIPTILLPGSIRFIALILPYRYMLAFPIELLMGKLSVSDIALGLQMQCLWVVLVLLLHRVVWTKGVKLYTAVGG